MLSLLLGRLSPAIRRDDDGFVCANCLGKCKNRFDLSHVDWDGMELGVDDHL